MPKLHQSLQIQLKINVLLKNYKNHWDMNSMSVVKPFTPRKHPDFIPSLGQKDMTIFIYAW